MHICVPRALFGKKKQAVPVSDSDVSFYELDFSEEHRQLVSSVPDMCVDAEVTRLQIELCLLYRIVPSRL